MGQYTNRLNLPEPIVNAVINDPYNPGDADISTTRLNNPPQIETLKIRYADKIEEDVSERIWSLLGQAVHVVLERASGKYVDPAEVRRRVIAVAQPEAVVILQKLQVRVITVQRAFDELAQLFMAAVDAVTMQLTGRITEKRYFASVLGWKLSGAVDLLDTKTLVDYKVTSTWTYIYKSRIAEWAAQGNVNRWLYFTNTGITVPRLKNVLILRDWQRRDIGKAGYPKVQVVTVTLPVWTMEKAEAYIKERVALHQASRQAPDDAQPPCSNEERWLDKKGKYNRCADFCPVKNFCQQLKREANGNNEPSSGSNSSADQGVQRNPPSRRRTGK